MILENRKQAGHLLSERLVKYKGTDSYILALPRGGVPVAAEIASTLGLPLNILAVRKIGAPFQQEMAIGAVCENRDPIWMHSILSKLGLQPDDMGKAVIKERNKIRQQIEIFRHGRSLENLSNRNVILVDDGLATGATLFAAIDYIKESGARKVIVAVPIAAEGSLEKIKLRVDDFVALKIVKNLGSVGEWYHDFSQVSNAEVAMTLDKFTI